MFSGGWFPNSTNSLKDHVMYNVEKWPHTLKILGCDLKQDRQINLFFNKQQANKQPGLERSKD